MIGARIAVDPNIARVPRGSWFSGAPSFSNDRLSMQLRVSREQGEIAWFRVGAAPVVMVSSAELAQEVLIAKDDAFLRSRSSSVFRRPMFGNGLLTSEREAHRQQRRRIAPSFVHKRMTDFVDVIAERTERLASSWTPGETIDATEAMTGLTLEIIGKTLFGAEIGPEAVEIGKALGDAVEYIVRAERALLPLPPSVPTPANLHYRRSLRRIDATIYRWIAERRASGRDFGDFLSMLLAAEDPDGGKMSDEQARDEAVTLFFAAYETSVTALAWAVYLLVQNETVYQRLVDEARSVLGDRRAQPSDLAHLPYALQVFKEAMRLYPPAYLIGRKAFRKVELGPYSISPGTIVLVNVYGLHHRADYFPTPNAFRPERFAPESEKAFPRHAYVPFGAGPRNCIGNHFALMEGQIALATLAARVRFERCFDAPIPPVARLALRPRDRIRVRVAR